MRYFTLLLFLVGLPAGAFAQNKAGDTLVTPAQQVWCIDEPFIADSLTAGCEEYVFSLFDRWGNLVAESNNPKATYSEMTVTKGFEHPNENQPFIYRITFSRNGEKKKYIGHILLQRDCNCG